MSAKFETPPMLSGSSEQQMKQMYSYLFRLSENLNVAMKDLSQQTATTTQTAAGKKSGAGSAEQAKTYNELRALITNTANTVRREISEIENTPVLRIDSSRGTVFKNNAVSTVLTVAIYKGKDRITDSAKLKEVFGSSARLAWHWQKMGESTFGTILSTDSRLSDDGFTFTLTPDDVNTKVTFMCQLVTD